MAQYKVGDKLYYNRTRCEVTGSTLKGGGVNMDEALLQIETAQGTPIVMLYKTAGRYLTEKPVPYFGKWPLAPQ